MIATLHHHAAQGFVSPWCSGNKPGNIIMRDLDVSQE